MKFLITRKAILATLTYFNMFDYPLKKREIYSFLGHAEDQQRFDQALTGLIDEHAVFKMGDFYCLYNNHSLADRRARGNERAALMLKKAEKAAHFISAFPFVRGVAVSGSLSKRYADDDADIDFFIITAASRLWIARTCLHIFKKITFLVNMQHFFCMNYFIDESEPCILEKNIYTATEVVTILPLFGTTVFDRFYTANKWTKTFLPNNYMHISAAAEIKRTWFCNILEIICNNQAGDLLDSFLMRLTAKSWDKKTRKNKKNSKGMLLSMHTGKHFSKPNPENFQKKLLQRYHKCLTEVFDQYEHPEPVKNNFL